MSIFCHNIKSSKFNLYMSIYGIIIWPFKWTMRIIWNNDRLILMACHHVWGYFMSKVYGITYVVFLYLQFLCSFFRVFFCTQSYGFKYSYYLSNSGQSGPGSNSNEGVIPHSSKFQNWNLSTRWSLISYSGPLLSTIFHVWTITNCNCFYRI